MKSLEAKIVVLGAQGVGKTSVVIRYVGKMFSKHVSPTIGASFFTCRMTLEDFRIKLQVWDTAGQERFRSMAPMYYRKANAAMLVYDITSYDSFIEMQTWVNELRRNVEDVVVLCVLGNKCDLDKERVVSSEDARNFASSLGALFFETSALSNQGIEDAFIQVALSLVKTVENGSNPNLTIYPSPSSSIDSLQEDLSLSTSSPDVSQKPQKQTSCC